MRIAISLTVGAALLVKYNSRMRLQSKIKPHSRLTSRSVFRASLSTTTSMACTRSTRARVSSGRKLKSFALRTGPL